MNTGVVRAVKFASDDLRRDCYYIASQFVGDAENLYYSIAHDVNVLGNPMFIHIQNGIVGGFIYGDAVHNGDGVGRVVALYVDRRRHRGGVGTQLLAAYSEYVLAAGAGKIVLHSRLTPAALNFYRAQGFVRMGQSNLMQKSL